MDREPLQHRLILHCVLSPATDHSKGLPCHCQTLDRAGCPPNASYALSLVSSFRLNTRAQKSWSHCLGHTGMCGSQATSGLQINLTPSAEPTLPHCAQTPGRRPGLQCSLSPSCRLEMRPGKPDASSCGFRGFRENREVLRLC